MKTLQNLQAEFDGQEIETNAQTIYRMTSQAKLAMYKAYTQLSVLQNELHWYGSKKKFKKITKMQRELDKILETLENWSSKMEG